MASYRKLGQVTKASKVPVLRLTTGGTVAVTGFSESRIQRVALVQVNVTALDLCINNGLGDIIDTNHKFDAELPRASERAGREGVSSILGISDR